MLNFIQENQEAINAFKNEEIDYFKLFGLELDDDDAFEKVADFSHFIRKIISDIEQAQTILNGFVQNLASDPSYAITWNGASILKNQHSVTFYIIFLNMVYSSQDGDFNKNLKTHLSYLDSEFKITAKSVAIKTGVWQIDEIAKLEALEQFISLLEMEVL